MGELPFVLLLLSLAVSCITFMAYAWDKSAAKHGKWRIRERALHLLSLAGGWPGALIAQKMLRHKSKKPSFQWLFWVTVALHCGLLGLLLISFTP